MKGTSTKRRIVADPSFLKPTTSTAPKRPRSKKSPVPPIAESFSIAEPESSTPTAEARRQKRVRDRFTMPREDYALIDALKERANELGLSSKKSELLRAGLHALSLATSEEFHALLEGLTPMRKKRERSAG